jgi:hypothetical protein
MTEDRRITDAYSVKLDAIQENVNDMKSVLRNLTEAVNRLGVIEERQATGAAATERAFKAIEKLENKNEVLEGRVVALEADTKESRRVGLWVNGGVLAVAGTAVGYVAKKVGLL